MEHQETDTPALLLRPGNFTPPTRTPWGGRGIRALKGLEEGPIVGESWELSVEPSFPSRTESGALLSSLLAEPTALLVKLLDAAAPLSLQIHPSDADPRLTSSESGKPEAWYVVAREPGAGLYLGLAPGVDRAQLQRAIEDGRDVSPLLPFVPVEPGDTFLIEAGTPHCVGAGVLLVEPQRVLPGRRGLTYRYWDWNRRYDEAGREDPAGAPRELHLEAALDVTRWDLPRGDALLERIRRRTDAPTVDGPAQVEPLIGRACPVQSAELTVARLTGTGRCELPVSHLTALTVLGGSVTTSGVRVDAGRTAALRPGVHGLQLENVHAIASSAPYDAA